MRVISDQMSSRTRTRNIGMHVSAEEQRSLKGVYRVVPNGLLTFLGSLYKEVTKTTSRTLVYHFEREKHCVLDLECGIISQELSDSCILYFNVIFQGK